MNSQQREFWQSIRSFIIRYSEYDREKGASPLQLHELEQNFSKILSTRQTKEVVINKITAIQLKVDYHNLIMLTLLLELSKWSIEHYQQLKHNIVLESIVSQSIFILNNQQNYHTIVPKQSQLISSLLCHPYTIDNIESFKILYRKLKDVKDFYPSAIKDHQKQCFLKTTEECIQKACKLNNLKIVEFIFNNIFNELEFLEQKHQFVSQRLKILKRLVKHLQTYHEQILYKISYLLMKYSYQITDNKQLFNHILQIYQNVMEKLIQKTSITPLLIYKHVVFNNIDKVLKSGKNFVMLEILLSQVDNLFSKTYLLYFMKNYDWNFMEVPICQQTLTFLYEYTENRSHQKKFEFELMKTYINRIHIHIKEHLEEIKNLKREQSKLKLYESKKKQYHELLQEMNQKPKKLFKRIDNITNSDLRQEAVHKYVKLVKKASHLDNRSMIDIFSTDNKTSAQLFAFYVEIVLKQCKEYNLEQFMRLFTSNFFLTGQSQQIGRVMDTITQLYYRHQQESNRILKSSDATYTFANAILILNTDLHNPKNQEKMSEQSFIKMCKKINQGEDLPLQVLKKTYNNIKKNKINTFRDRGNMFGISPSNWIIICSDYQSLNLSYYDPELLTLNDRTVQNFIHDILASIIDEKQTTKLQLLVERFVYDDKVFQCEIIENMRRILDKKPHIPLHILQKILELANFKNKKISEKLLSYYWLAANIIQTFSHHIPTNLICEFLVFTWSIRIQLQDYMYERQSAELRRIRQCIKFITKRQAKKSIMTMFSSFLSFKQSDDQIEVLPNEINKRINFKSISNNLFDIIKYSENHRKLGIQFLINYIHNEQAKLYEEFISCMFLTFNLLYYIEGCEQSGESLFLELLGVKESSITKRINNLNKKDNKLYNNVINYCQFWILKLLLKQYSLNKIEHNNSFKDLLHRSLEYLQKIDQTILEDLLKEIKPKAQIHKQMFQSFDRAIKKIYGKDNLQEVQFFYDKFSKKETIQINSTHNQKNHKTEPPQTPLKIQNPVLIEKIEPKENISLVQEVKQLENASVPNQTENESISNQTDNQPTPKQINNEQKQQQMNSKPVQQQLEQSESTEIKKDIVETIPLQDQIITKYNHRIELEQSEQNIQQFINPDAMIDQIQQQIQSHLQHNKQQIENTDKEDTQLQKEKEDAQSIQKLPQQNLKSDNLIQQSKIEVDQKLPILEQQQIRALNISQIDQSDKVELKQAQTGPIHDKSIIEVEIKKEQIEPIIIEHQKYSQFEIQESIQEQLNVDASEQYSLAVVMF